MLRAEIFAIGCRRSPACCGLRADLLAFAARTVDRTAWSSLLPIQRLTSSPASPHRVSGARRGLGAVIAIAALVASAALAWYLTHRPAEAPGGGAFAGGAGAASSGASGERPADRGGARGRAPAAAARAGGGGRGGARRPRRAPSTVGVATAARADLPVVLDALGTVTPVTTVTVRPQVSGVITQVLFTEGQIVKKGQLLVTIDPRSFEIALQQAIGARQRDEAQLDSARRAAAALSDAAGGRTRSRARTSTPRPRS